MEKLIHRIVEALVDHPEQIAINEIRGGRNGDIGSGRCKRGSGQSYRQKKAEPSRPFGPY